jgi:hypothetical protein
MSAPQAEIGVGRTFIPPSGPVQARNKNGSDAGGNSVAQHGCAPAAKEFDNDTRECNLNP